MPVGHEEKIIDDVTTENAYVDSLIVEVLNYPKAVIWIKNTGATYELHWKILGKYSVIDPDADWEEEKAQAVLNTSTSAVQEITKPYAAIKVQIKSETTDEHTTCDSFCVKKRY